MMNKCSCVLSLSSCIRVYCSDDYQLYVRRWNLFHAKMQRAVNEMSLRNFRWYANCCTYTILFCEHVSICGANVRRIRALDLMENARFDFSKLHELKMKATDNIRTILSCRKDNPTPLTRDPARMLHVLAPISSVLILAIFAYFYLLPMVKRSSMASGKGKQKRW